MKVDVRQRVVLWVRENGLVALLATVLALLVYMTILELVSNTTTRTVPVEVEREAGMALMSVRPSTVQVTFRGALNEFQILDRSDLRMVVNGLRNHGDQGIARITLRRKNLRGAGSVRVVSVEPSEIEVTFEHQGEREFTIAPPKVEGRPYRGHAEVEFTPRTALVRGARLQLDRLHEAGVTLQLDPVNVDGRVQGFSLNVPILPPEDAWQPEIDPATVALKISIVPDNVLREFTGVQVHLATPAGRTNCLPRVEPPEVTVRLTGWAETLQGVTTNTVRVLAVLPDDPGANPTNPVPLRVLLPPGTVADEAVTVPEAVRLLPPEAAAEQGTGDRGQETGDGVQGSVGSGSRRLEWVRDTPCPHTLSPHLVGYASSLHFVPTLCQKLKRVRAGCLRPGALQEDSPAGVPPSGGSHPGASAPSPARPSSHPEGGRPSAPAVPPIRLVDAAHPPRGHRVPVLCPPFTAAPSHRVPVRAACVPPLLPTAYCHCRRPAPGQRRPVSCHLSPVSCLPSPSLRTRHAVCLSSL
ncbi:MAG: hypothetical protein GX174_00050 [Lentisphaerae bacterium]|nr:hypothetical protein [Lentisphaerota bacterium]